MEYFVPAEGLKDEPDPIEEVENLEEVELRREVLPYGVRPRPYVPVPIIKYKYNHKNHKKINVCHGQSYVIVKGTTE